MAITKHLKGECQHCGGHLEFPAEHTGLVADCPHCGQSTELMLARPPEEPAVPRKAIIWAVIAVVILGLGLGASLVALRIAENRVHRLHPKLPPAAALVVDPLAQQGFSVTPIQLEKAPGTSVVYATGVLKNNTQRQRFGVKLELDLADAAGTKIGTATDYQQLIEPGAEWRFRALVVDAKAASATLVSVKEQQ